MSLSVHAAQVLATVVIVLSAALVAFALYVGAVCAWDLYNWPRYRGPSQPASPGGTRDRRAAPIPRVPGPGLAARAA